MRLAIDLDGAQAELSKFAEYKELAKKIKLYISARSFQLDLQSAAQSIEYMKEIDPAGGELRFKVGQPLMLHAVMMYCRAAIEDGSGRHPMGVTSDFTPSQRVKHQDIVRLRNKTMAHYGIAEGAYGERWIREVPVVKIVDGRASLTDAWQRANYLARLVADLDEVCTVALETVSRKLADRTSSLAATLFPMWERDAKLARILLSHPFDPQAFFGSQDSADGFWGDAPSRHEIYTPRITTTEFSVEIGPPVATKI